MQRRNDADYATHVSLDPGYASRRTLCTDLEVLARIVGVATNRKGTYWSRNDGRMLLGRSRRRIVSTVS